MIDPKTLRDLQFFSDLTDEELEVMAGIVNKKDFKTGDVVFKETESGTSLYIIRKGEVKACKMAPDGELLTLTIMKDGEIFGEMSFLDGRPRSATIVAISDVETYVIEKADFDTIVDEHPRIIYKILKNIVFTIHSIVRGMNTRYMEMINYMWGRRR
ncbi:MAG TPA: cyclic nucleotide-binding domain-containing protein [Deltaproteobacteria bacterium]|nr:cyclic nucleotide-binding domain-containing protein [Deltaproteobacteria bacterium]